MKKKILFIIGDLNIGGVQKSLLASLHYFDYQNYDVSLLILKSNNFFIDKVPKTVKIIDHAFNDAIFDKPTISLIRLIKSGNILLFFMKFIQLFIQFCNKGLGAFVLSRLMNMTKQPDILNDKYDAIIDYGGQQLLYFMVDFLQSDIKISYFHNDYKKWDYYYLTDKFFYRKVDNIVTVSEICSESLQEYFPDLKDKIVVIENIVDKDTMEIYQDAEVVKLNSDKFKIMSVGRVCYDKGVDMAIEAAKILKEKQVEFIWYWIGPGDLMNYPVDGVNDCFKFLGLCKAPYQILKQCDLYVQPSRFEGKAMTIEEAKVLGLPIITTNFSTVTNQITDGVNGFICEMNAIDIANKIEMLISKINDFSIEPQKSNRDEIKKLYNLLEK